MQTNLIFCKFVTIDVIKNNRLLSITLGSTITIFKNKFLYYRKKKPSLQLYVTIIPCFYVGKTPIELIRN